jgi:hypothetical protein
VVGITVGGGRTHVDINERSEDGKAMLKWVNCTSGVSEPEDEFKREISCFKQHELTI